MNLTRYEPIGTIGRGMGRDGSPRPAIGRDVAIKSLSLDRARDATARGPCAPGGDPGRSSTRASGPSTTSRPRKGRAPASPCRYVAGIPPRRRGQRVPPGRPRSRQQRRRASGDGAVCGAVHYAHRRGGDSRPQAEERDARRARRGMCSTGRSRGSPTTAEPVKARSTPVCHGDRALRDARLRRARAVARRRRNRRALRRVPRAVLFKLPPPPRSTTAPRRAR